MIQYFKTVDNDLRTQESECDGVWINLTNPSADEILKVSRESGAQEAFLQAALDEEETPRIERDDKQTLILVDVPVVEPEGTSFIYNTMPLGIVLLDNMVITVCLEETTIISDFFLGRIRGFDTCKKTRFILQLLYKTSVKYLQYLRQVDKASTQVEMALHKSLKNRELIQMLKLEKSLVFFSTSLKANEIVLEKMLKTKFIKRYPDDEDLLEDVIIENKQAIEMAAIYRDILSGTMDAFASVISNNLNIVMKFLAAVTIILSVPTLIASFWGMNVDVPFEKTAEGFVIVSVFALFITGIVTFILWKKKML
ncbi:MAG: magnesium transporter CorA family protein [Christensenellales bacterium]